MRQNSIIKAYFKAFVNNKPNDWAKLLLIAEFTYNNVKNLSIGHILFELNYGYNFRVFFDKDINLRSKSKLVDKLSTKFWKLITMCRKNLYYK